MAGLIFLWQTKPTAPTSDNGGGSGKKREPEFPEDFWNKRNPDAEHNAAIMRICMNAIGCGLVR